MWRQLVDAVFSDASVSSSFGAGSLQVGGSSSGLGAVAHSSFVSFSKPFAMADTTNTYKPKDTPELFVPETALGPGSGYWVTDGAHGPEEVVSFRAELRHRHRANGVRVNWAYAPDYVRVRVSGDGESFQDSVCWRKPREGESFEQKLEFDRPRNIKAIRLDMTKPRDYKFFGINQLSLF